MRAIKGTMQMQNIVVLSVCEIFCSCTTYILILHNLSNCRIFVNWRCCHEKEYNFRISCCLKQKAHFIYRNFLYWTNEKKTCPITEDFCTKKPRVVKLQKFAVSENRKSMSRYRSFLLLTTEKSIRNYRNLLLLRTKKYM